MASNCEAEDCWFGRNLDRSDEYEDGEYICNSGTVDELGHDIATQTTPPVMFCLCCVCWHNCRLRKQGRCAECWRVMVDMGIQWEGKWYCRYCLDENDIAELISAGNKLACADIPEWEGPLSECEQKPEDLTWEDYRDRTDPTLSELLDAGLSWRKKQREKQREQKRKRKREAALGLIKLVPNLSEPTSKRVVKRLKLEKTPKTVQELVEMFLNE